MRYARPFLLILVTLILTYSYLYPGSAALFEGRTDTVMSDGTDVTGVTYIWDNLRKVWEEHPSRFLYGSVYFDGGDPERGWPVWVSWIERPLGLGLVYTIQLEQITTGLVFCLLLLNVLAMYALGRYAGWNPWVAFGLAIAWSFSCYTRARAQVHIGFAGVYHIPLIFLGLLLIVRGKTWRSAAGAAILFMLAAMVPHYYIITAAFLSPFLIAYVWLQPETRERRKQILLRLTAAVLPAALFLALNLKFPLPPDAKTPPSAAFPATGDTPHGQLHPFLSIYAARPVDYFTSDLGLSDGPSDINPLKTWLNTSVYEAFFKSQLDGNTHERTNGIRWVIWALFLGAIAAAWRAKKGHPLKRQVYFFCALAAFAFALSLSPETFGYGPSAWLHKLVSQIRVPSRAGIWVHFSLLMAVGMFLSSEIVSARLKRWSMLPLGLAALMVMEYPPFWQQMRMAPVAPAYKELQRENGACGVGFYFPLASLPYAQVLYYKFLERMRGTDCYFLNSMGDQRRLMEVTKMFPPSEQYMSQLANDGITPLRMQRLAQCVPLSFVAFDPSTPVSIAMQLCQNLGWTLTQDLLCLAPKRGMPLQKFPDECTN